MITFEKFKIRILVMSLFDAVEDLFKSCYESPPSSSAVSHLIQSFMIAVLRLFTGIINMVCYVYSGIMGVDGGIITFLFGWVSGFETVGIGVLERLTSSIGNITILGVIGAGILYYICAPGNSEESR